MLRIRPLMLRIYATSIPHLAPRRSVRRWRLHWAKLDALGTQKLRITPCPLRAVVITMNE
jgi:hypothetical protein